MKEQQTKKKLNVTVVAEGIGNSQSIDACVIGQTVEVCEGTNKGDL